MSAAPAPAAPEPAAASSTVPPAAALGLLVLAALALRLAVAWQPLDVLVTHAMPDDGFYYLQIARHIAAGDGVTFDGTALTNGFHPLWMALLVPVLRVAGGDAAQGAHAALTLAAFLDVVTIWLLARTVARVTGAGAAGIAAAAWYAFNPAVVTQVANGLETALTLLCLAALFAFAVAGRARERLTLRWWAAFGCACGLAMLARSDNVVPVVVIGAGLCIAPWRPRRVPGLALAAAVGAAWQAPWLVWNWRTFGRLLQTSASAYSVVTRGNLAAAGRGPLTVTWYAVRDSYTWLVRTLPLDLAGESKIVGIAVGVIVAALAFGAGRRIVASLRAFALPALACLALLLANTLLRGTAKVWYAAPAALIMAYGAGVVWQAIAQGAGSRAARVGAGALVATVVASGYALNGATIVTRGLYPWQAEMLAAGRWLHERAPDDAVVGSFNSGIIGYVSGRTVVNLDGLVNTAAADAVRDRRLGAYIDGRGIRLLVDYRYTLFEDYRRFYGEAWNPDTRLEPVEEFAVSPRGWAGSHVGAYRLRGPATPGRGAG